MLDVVLNLKSSSEKAAGTIEEAMKKASEKLAGSIGELTSKINESIKKQADLLSKADQLDRAAESMKSTTFGGGSMGIYIRRKLVFIGNSWKAKTRGS